MPANFVTEAIVEAKGADSETYNVETYELNADIAELISLIITAESSNKDIFLSQLIFNSSDALDKIKYESLTDPGCMVEESELKIDIFVNKKKRTITITDTGCGMTKEEL